MLREAVEPIVRKACPECSSQETPPVRFQHKQSQAPLDADPQRAEAQSSARPRLLVVDDDPALLEVIAAILQPQFEVTACSDALEALDKVREGAFDVGLYDLCMDTLSGTELLMLTLGRSEDFPVLLMTGDPTVDRAVSALRAGAEDLLLKPLDFGRLGARLLAAARRQRGVAAGRLAVVHEALIRAVEARDPTTSGHAERVQGICLRIGEKMGISGEEKDTLARSALLHDIGKIGVPDSILSKPGRLSETEYEVIKQHPEVGARILEPLPGTEDIRRCILEHHERWDGTGYPRGLKGEEVSRVGRVLILVEVFDALAHARSYKAAWPLPRIREYVREASGSHFDPDLVPVFDDLLQREPHSFLPEAGDEGLPGGGDRGLAAGRGA